MAKLPAYGIDACVIADGGAYSVNAYGVAVLIGVYTCDVRNNFGI